MMRILLVEDDDSAIATVLEILLDLSARHVPTVAKNRDDALELLSREFFDLMILDLKIPTDANVQVALPVYGLAVFGCAKRVAPGMPIVLFTGSSVEEFVPSLLANQQQVDIWGSGKLGTVQVVKKIDLDKFAQLLTPYSTACTSLADVEIERAAGSLTQEDERLLRIFARRFNCTRCVVTPLAGGLSAARVVKVKALSPQGAVRVHAVAKLGSIDTIQDENERYQQYVVQLAPGATSRLLVTLEFGAKSTAAVFYSLAAGHDVSFFGLVEDTSPLIEVAIRGTSAGLSGWYEAAAEGQYQVRDLRKILLNDQSRAEVLGRYPLAWSDDFEDRRLQARWGLMHGDLHGANVLLTAKGSPAIIDYGDIGYGPCSLDPVTLELSVLFHPDGPFRNSEWPSPEQALRWGEMEHYLLGCPCSDFVRRCREWARNVAAGNREVAASAYIYLLRQLKYQDTDKQRVLDLLEGTRRMFTST